MSSRQRPFAPLDFKVRYPALDGIRALAVTMVFVSHYGGGTHGGRFWNWIDALRKCGWIGVDLFFVLSGFLITGILYDTRSDIHFFKRFYARRSVRIFPIFYLVFALLFVLTPVFQFQWRVGHLSFLIYMGNFAQMFDPSLENISAACHGLPYAHIGHFWSLCVEEQFYLIWPLIVWRVRERGALIRLAVGLSIAALALRLIFIFPLPPDTYIDRIIQVTPFRMDSLLIGAILALVLRSPSADRWQRSCKWLFPLATLLIIALTLVSPSRTSGWLVTIGLSLIALAAAGLIGLTLRSDSWGFRLFHLRPLRILGKYSYGFYIYHLIFASGWRHLSASLTAHSGSRALANTILFLANFALTLLVSALSYNFFEVRFLRLKKHFEYDAELTEHKHALVT